MSTITSAAQLNELLRRHRRKAHMTQEALAKRLHINHSNVSRIESGDQMPDINYIEAFLRVEEFALDLGQQNEILAAYKHFREQSNRRRRLEPIDSPQPTPAAPPLAQSPQIEISQSDVLQRYLSFVADMCSQPMVSNLGIASAFATVPLPEVFIPLRARIELPDSETWNQEREKNAEAMRGRQLEIRGRLPTLEEVETIGEFLSAPKPIIDLLKEHHGLVILGDPGSGKSTLLKHLAMLLATGQGDVLGMAGHVPLIMPIRAYAQVLNHRDLTPVDFLEEYYSQQAGYPLPLKDIFQSILKRGEALVLWDGLDEIPDLTERKRVVDRVRKFFQWNHQQGNRFVVTSRIIGYQDAPLHAIGLTACVLSDFNAHDIEDFVDKWTEAMAKRSTKLPEIALRDARREEADLLIALRRDPGIRKLASNPLLLTLMVILRHRQGTTQSRRAQLYEQFVQTLLNHWNLARSLDARGMNVGSTRHTQGLLGELALWIQQDHAQRGVVNAEVLRRRLIDICAAQHMAHPADEAEQLLRHARDYAGLLIDLGPSEYGFIHRTLQEYLAAYAIAVRAEHGAAPVFDLLAPHISDPAWHEVILLTVGCLGSVRHRGNEASELILQMLEATSVEHGELRVLIGKAATEAGIENLSRICKDRISGMLVDLMVDDTHTSPLTRANAGNALAELGDLRTNIMTVTGMEFCYVAPGLFDMGGNEGTQDEHDDVIHMNTLLDYDYWLGRFPVTNAQFEEFIKAGGYHVAKYWSEAQALGIWRPGEVRQGFYRWDDGFGGFRFWSHYWSDRPLSYGAPFNLPNHPVNNLSWYECLAFTRWLNDRHRLTERGWYACLPSDPEWEKAARGGHEKADWVLAAQKADINGWTIKRLTDQWPTPIVHSDVHSTPLPSTPANLRRFAWGMNEDPNRGNYRDAEIRTTNTVGIFPSGASPYGCEEMIGNVWEWTRSLWGPSNYERVFHYPYNSTHDREDLMAGVEMFRTLRGGSYFSLPIHARCPYRRRNAPDYICENLGFRVAVIPYIKTSPQQGVSVYKC